MSLLKSQLRAFGPDSGFWDVCAGALGLRSQAPQDVAGVVGIQPYMTNNTQSSEQIFCRKLASEQPPFPSRLAELNQ